MDIRLSKQDRAKVKTLLTNKETNIAVAEMLGDLCLIRDEEAQAYIKENLNNNIRIEEIATSILGVDKNDSTNNEIIKKYINNQIDVINDEIFVNNPYNLQIKPAKLNNNQYSLSFEHYPEFSFFPLDDISVEANTYIEKSSIAIFKNEYRFLCLKKDSDIWMCITPNEIKTMEKAISQSHGHVLTYGLGLGYYAFMTSNKKEVSKVTVVESDENIINIFLTYLLPQFPNRDKIEIIKEDAYNHYQKIVKKEYDFCFVDIYHDANDGAMVFAKFLAMEKEYLKPQFWIETSLIAMIRRCLLTIIEEAIVGGNPIIYTKSKNDEDKLINYLYNKTKMISLVSYDDIISLLTDSSIKAILR